MSTILTPEEIESMREGGRKLIAVFELLKPMVRPGANILEIAARAEAAIAEQGGVASFKGYDGYPAALCLSTSEQVVHCVPTDRILKEGDILAVDMGIYYGGVHTDAAVTWPVGKITPELERLLSGTHKALLAGTDQVRPGARIDQISQAIESVLKREGLTIFKQFVGHGIGHQLHEDPYIPNFSTAGVGSSLSVNQAIAIEPITGIGVDQVITAPDGWSVTTSDGAPAAHFEHTVLVTPKGYEIITPLETLIESGETLDS